MTEQVHLDPDVLVSYLYDECEPAERAMVIAHLAACEVCAAEVSDLTATRRHLADWAPPDVALGFQITRAAVSSTEPAEPARVLRPERWWSRPLPAWAQAAAAVLIFGAGLAAGIRNTGGSENDSTATASQTTTTPVVSTSLDEGRLAGEVEQLRAELAEVRRASTAATAAPAASPSDAQLMERVRALIDESAKDQRIEFTVRVAELARDFEVQRRVDRQATAATISRVQGQAGAEAQRQQRNIEGLARMVLDTGTGR